jgi:GT2 family glycosyltransferase
MKKRYDIVIVNYNSTDHVVKCLDSCKSCSRHNKIRAIVIDNASNDDPEKIKFFHPETVLIKNTINTGFSKAVNIGLRESRSDFVLLLNPDTILLDGFFEALDPLTFESNTIGIAGPKIYDPDGKLQGSARKFPTIQTSLFGRKSLLTKLFPDNRFTRKEILCYGDHGTKEFEVDWVSGACMIIRRKAVLDVGGFDEDFFLYWEDADLCQRVRKAGWKVIYYPKAEIIHSVGKSSATRPIVSKFHFYFSCFKLVVKHTSHSQKLCVPLVFVGLWLSFIFSISANLLSRLVSQKN